MFRNQILLFKDNYLHGNSGTSTIIWHEITVFPIHKKSIQYTFVLEIINT